MILEIIREPNIDFLNYLIENGYSIKLEDVATNACLKNKLDVLEWLIQKGFKLDPILLIDAGRNKNIELLNWLRDHGIKMTENDMAGTRVSDLQTIEWLKQSGYFE